MTKALGLALGTLATTAIHSTIEVDIALKSNNVECGSALNMNSSYWPERGNPTG